MASFYEVISQGEEQHGLSSGVVEDLRKIFLRRFKQLVDDVPDDIYFSGFVLDPREYCICYGTSVRSNKTVVITGFRGFDILRDLNRLRLKVVLQRADTASVDDSSLPSSILCAIRFVLKLLRIEYEKKHIKVAGLSGLEAITRCKKQVQQFVTSTYPFNRPLRDGEGPKEWWKAISQNPDAQPLAVRDHLIAISRLHSLFY